MWTSTKTWEAGWSLGFTCVADEAVVVSVTDDALALLFGLDGFSPSSSDGSERATRLRLEEESSGALAWGAIALRGLGVAVSEWLYWSGCVFHEKN